MSQIKDPHHNLSQALEQLKNQALESFQNSTQRQELYDQKVRFLGKQGLLTDFMKKLSGVPKEERPKWGQLLNQIKVQLESRHAEVETKLQKKELDQKIQSEKIDVTLPSAGEPLGTSHPVTLVTREFFQIMSRLGYSLNMGPCIESDHYNFQALNIPQHHPARDMQDTFFVDDNLVLRTHTSPVWSRYLESNKPPFRILGTGPVFRCDSDISHLPHFHQFEAALVDRKVSMSDLKGTISFVVREFFGQGLQTRFRPSFFPFTEPSAEVDCTCPICHGKGCSLCKQSGWIEIGGCGLIHPNVFSEAKVSSEEWQGFAFGFGIERMAIIKYGIPDIRLFPENDLRFLTQFGA